MEIGFIFLLASANGLILQSIFYTKILARFKLFNTYLMGIICLIIGCFILPLSSGIHSFFPQSLNHDFDNNNGKFQYQMTWVIVEISSAFIGFGILFAISILNTMFANICDPSQFLFFSFYFIYFSYLYVDRKNNYFIIINLLIV